MKTKTVIAMLAAALMLAGCGSAEGSSVGAAEDVSQAQSQAEQPQEGSEAEESQAEIDSSEEEPEVTESVPEAEDESLPDEESAPEDAQTDYEKLLATVSDDYKFESFAESVSFSQLQAAGLANVIGEGRAYALVYASGGAGSLMYDVYHTSDGGESWEKGDVVSFFNGTTSRFAVEDGRLVTLIRLSSAFDQLPKAYCVSCSDDFTVTVTELEDWFASPSIPKDKPFNAYTDYKGGYVLGLTLKVQTDESESEEAFFSEDVTLDPETLTPM